MEIGEEIFVVTGIFKTLIITSGRVEYPLTPPEGSWRKMKINPFSTNERNTNLKKKEIKKMKAIKENKETKVRVNIASKVNNVPNYSAMIRLYGTNVVANMLNNL